MQNDAPIAETKSGDAAKSTAATGKNRLRLADNALYVFAFHLVAESLALVAREFYAVVPFSRLGNS